MSKTAPYVENEDFVPEPTAQFGTLDTSGTAGSAHAKIEEISPVFAVADHQNAVQAAKALDPKDPSVHESLVILPDSARGYDDAVKAVKDKAKAAKAPDPLQNRTTPAQEQAAESGADAGAAAAAQQADHGASGAADGSGTGTAKESAKTGTAGK